MTFRDVHSCLPAALFLFFFNSQLDVSTKFQNNPSAKSDDELLQTPSGQRSVTYEDDKHETGDDSHAIADSKAMKTESTGDGFFMIPDLNAMPSEDDNYSEC